MSDNKTPQSHGTKVILRDFEIENAAQTEPTEAELLDLLRRQIEVMLERRPEFLFSLLYRMDVKEAKANAALHPLAPDPPAVGLAKLVMERQKERNRTRELYRQKPIEDLEEGLEF